MTHVSGNDSEAMAQAPAATEPLVLSVPEAAAILRISRDLAYELIRRGELPALRLGRRVVVPRKGLLEFVAGG